MRAFLLVRVRNHSPRTLFVRATRGLCQERGGVCVCGVNLAGKQAIQIVGYDSAASPPYWIVRNSWNTDWGLDGYMHLKMGENTCGLADKAAMVTLA